ncbi:MAG: DUF424 family protein [Nanoarchaeota archaeon]
MMYIKVHRSYRLVVAICDKELLGKKFEEGIKQLEIQENFFKGEEADSDEIIEHLKNFSMDDATFNIVGEKSINTALKAGIIAEGGIGMVQGVPFALVLL